MKKIFIIFSILSLFVGCASTSKTLDVSNEVVAIPNEVVAIPNEISQEEALLNQPIITRDEFEPCAWKNTKYFIETDRKDLTIKIINTSNEKLYLQFMTMGVDNGEYRDRRWFYAELNPGETGFYNFFDFISLKEDGIEISIWDSSLGKFKRIWSAVRHYFEEIVKNHSLEIIYDGVRPDAYDVISHYDYRFIEPFECEFDMEWKSDHYSYIDDSFTFKAYNKGEKN